MNIKPIQQHIDDEHGGSKPAFAESMGKTTKQVHRYIEMCAWWVNGAVVQIRHGSIDLSNK